MLRREGTSGFLSGLCIALGGSVYLACESRYVGALLFSVALLSICSFGFSLYTGRIGLIVENHSAAAIRALLLGLLGNLVGCLLFGALIRFGVPSLYEAAQGLCAGKLAQSAPGALIRAFFCGVLMYIAVWTYKSKNTPLGIFVCIPAFILSGFEHSIANVFYFAAGGCVSVQCLVYILLIVAGNTLGGVMIPLAQSFAKERQTNG